MSCEFFIAGRYLKVRRKGFFSMITTIIGIAGVTIGVAALIITLAIMNGFQSEIKRKVIDAQAHMLVYGQISAKEYEIISQKISSEQGVESFSPFVLGQAIITFGNRSIGVVLKGFEKEKEFKINNLKSSLSHGDWKNFKEDLKSPVIILGEELARNMGVWLGDEVVLVSPKSMSTSFGIFPKMKKFKVIGTVNTGYYEFDNTMAYCHIKSASDFFNMNNGFNGIGIKLHNIKNASEVALSLKKKLGFPFVVKTYADMNRTLFAALKLEKFVMSLVLALIILVATFNIASNLLLMSVEKVRDIGILRAIGASPLFIKKIFLWEGNLIAVSGIILGVILGLIISYLVGKYPIVELPSDIYYITKVPVEIKIKDVFATVGASYVLCLLSMIYPALKASRISPVDAIRYG